MIGFECTFKSVLVFLKRNSIMLQRKRTPLECYVGFINRNRLLIILIVCRKTSYIVYLLRRLTIRVGRHTFNNICFDCFKLPGRAVAMLYTTESDRLICLYYNHSINVMQKTILGPIRFIRLSSIGHWHGDSNV